MNIKAQLEALIYAAEEPITLDQMAALLKDDLLALKNAPQADQETLSDGSEPSQPDTTEQAENHLGAVEEAAEPRAAKHVRKNQAKKNQKRPSCAACSDPIWTS